MERKKINFIERNRKILSKSENQSTVSQSRAASAGVASETASVESAVTAKRNVKPKPLSRPPLTTRNSETAPSVSDKGIVKKPLPSSKSLTVLKNSNVRPKSAPAKTVSKAKVPSRNAQNEDEVDIVTKLLRRNLHGCLRRIFIPQSNVTLISCKEVCRSWLRVMRVLWRQTPFLTIMKERLTENWLRGRYEKVALQMVAGIACKKKCKENFRDCKCGGRINCQVIGNNLYLEFGGKQFEGRYTLASEFSDNVCVPFPVEQDQIKFNLKCGLELETKDWLTTPEIIQMKMKTKIMYEDYIIEKSPGHKNTLLIKNAKTKEIVAKQVMFSDQPANSPLKDGIVGLNASAGRLAVNIGGRVYVHDFEGLLKGQTRIQTLIKLPGCGDDLDQYPKIEKKEIYYFYLSPNFLLLVIENHVILYNFWKYSSSSNQTKQDFIL